LPRVRRVADLTHQILAYSRRQALQPRVISVNDLPAELEPLLREKLSKGTELDLILEPELGFIHVRVSYLRKPFTPEALSRRVRKALDVIG
jgi:hypothetical protein